MITTPYRWKTRFGALAGFLALTSLAGPSFSATAGSNLIDLKIDNGSTGNNSSVYINQQGVENVIGNDGRFAAFSPTGGNLTGASNLASNKIAFTVTLQQASFSAGTVGDGTPGSGSDGSDVTFAAAQVIPSTGTGTLASASTRALMSGLNHQVEIRQEGNGNFLSLDQTGDDIDLSYLASGNFNVTELDVGQETSPTGNIRLALAFTGNANTFDFNLGATSGSLVDGSSLEFNVTGNNNFGFVDITGDSNTNYVDLSGSGNAFALEQSGASNLFDALMSIDDSEVLIEQTSDSNSITLELSGDNQAIFIHQGATASANYVPTSPGDD